MSVSVITETYDFYIFPEQVAITDLVTDSIRIYFSLLLLFVGFSSVFHSYSIIISRLWHVVDITCPQTAVHTRLLR